MSDHIDELVETVRTACEVIDDEGSTPSRPCTVYGDALTDLATIARKAERWRRERLTLLAAYIGARDFDGGCLCTECQAAITARLNDALELAAVEGATDE
jgi:hypothetical protein